MSKTETTKASASAATHEEMTAAERALAEAELRRQAFDEERNRQPAAPEIGGPNGPDPARYGDWEKNGIAKDF